MEGQYGKGDPLSFDLYKTCPQLKAPFTKYCKVFETRLRSLVPEYRVLPVNEEQTTKLDVAGLITEWKSNGKHTLKPLPIDVQFLEHHKTQYLELHRELQNLEYSRQSQAALQNLKTLLLLEIQLLLGCDVEWSVPTPPDRDPPVLPPAGDDADADNTSEEGGSIRGAASPRRMRTRGAETTATPPRAVGTPSRIRNGGGAFYIADHGCAYRNNNVYDAVKALNEFAPKLGF
jgi:hypothetical protein